MQVLRFYVDLLTSGWAFLQSTCSRSAFFISLICKSLEAHNKDFCPSLCLLCLQKPTFLLFHRFWYFNFAKHQLFKASTLQNKSHSSHSILFFKMICIATLVLKSIWILSYKFRPNSFTAGMGYSSFFWLSPHVCCLYLRWELHFKWIGLLFLVANCCWATCRRQLQQSIKVQSNIWNAWTEHNKFKLQSSISNELKHFN